VKWRLATIIWHILKRQTTYQFRYDPIATAQTKTFKRSQNTATVTHEGMDRDAI